MADARRARAVRGVPRHNFRPRKILRTLKALACVALCACPALGHAQTWGYLEAGGARVRYDDTMSVTPGTLSAAANALTPSTSFSGLVAASTTRQSSWTVFGSAQGSVLTPALGALRGELHGSGSVTAYSGGSAGTGQLLGGARLHLARGVAGVWIGAAAGSVRDPFGWRSSNSGEFGAWLQLSRAVVQAVVLPVRIAGGVRYTDVEGTLRFDNSRVELTGVAGARSAIAGYSENRSAWASVNAIAWISPAIGITAGAGSYPTDPGQDLPAATYLSLGVRYSPWSVRRASTVLSPDVLSAVARDAPPAMTVSDGASGRRTISYRAAAARSVEIMGDFTDWTPVPMILSRPPGTWSVSLPVTSGVHQVNVRIDGGEWSVPAGLTAVRDEFGGSVGILLVP